MFRNSGIKLGKFLGIPVYLHPTWFIIWFIFTLSLANAMVLEKGASALVAYPLGALVALAAFATLLAHEYGHALTARAFGIGTERITLFILGGVAQIKDEPKRPLEEFFIAIAGPLVSVGCLILFGLPALLLYQAQMAPLLVFNLGNLAGINLVFAVFNMIPGFPMDGGRVLRAIVWRVSGNYLTATRVAAFGGQTFSIVLMVFGGYLLLNLNPSGFMPLLLGFFLNRLAKMSYRQAQFKAAFDSVRVKDLMRPIQAVVPADLPVSSVVRDYLYRIHSDRFPVVRGQSLLGYISAEDISSLDKGQWDFVRAENLARPYGRSEILSPYQNVFSAFQEVSVQGRPQLPVFHEKKLIGHLFRQDVTNYLQRFGARPPH